jgi:hypothetical protein
MVCRDVRHASTLNESVNSTYAGRKIGINHRRTQEASECNFRKRTEAQTG